MSERDQSLDLGLIFSWLKAGWRTIAIVSIGAFVTTYLVSKLAITTIWGAEAVIRPSVRQQQMMDLFNPVGGSSLGALGFSSMTTGNSTTAEEDISILKSFDFTNRLLDNYHFADHISPPAAAGSGGIFVRLGLKKKQDLPEFERYRIYRLMSKRFSADFDMDSGNIKLTYMDEDPGWARQILQWYVDQLREMLRQEEIDQARPAYEALRAEAQTMADPGIAAQMYDLAAHQLEKLKLATVQTGYAFKIIQSSVVPDRPKRPRPLVYSLVVGSAAFAGSILWITAIGASRLSKVEEETTKQPRSVAYRK